MRFVDRDQGELAAPEPFQGACTQQAFRGHIKQIEAPVIEQVGDARNLARLQFRMERACGNIKLAQGGDLIVHQRDQRGDHECRAFAHECRHLVAHAFAAAGRHQNERVFAGDDGVHRLLLQAAEFWEAENAVENFFGGLQQIRLE